MVVNNGAGCRDTIQKTISIGAVPDATIIDAINPFNPFKVCATGSFDIQVQNGSTTTAANTGYRINWGDGSPDYVSSSFTAPISHTYPGSGFYTLKFTVTSISGCASTSSQDVFIGSNPSVGVSSLGSTVGLCVPFKQTFLIDTARTNQNAQGTIYYVTYNDGSKVDTFYHPAPPTFTHSFTKTSCGATSGRIPNTFFVSIRAENPCGFSDAIVEPITTVTKPNANFRISPSSTVCKGTTVTLSDSTINGIFVDNNGNCITNYNRFWTITPGTGGTNWSITSGTLGTLPSTSGSSNIGVVFNNEGTYTIRLIVRTNISSGSSCIADTITKVINVGGFSDASISLCSDSSFVYIPSTNQTGNTYSWTISPNPNVSGYANQAVFTSTIVGNNLRNLTNVTQTLIYTITPQSSTGGPVLFSFQFRIKQFVPDKLLRM